MGRANKTNQAPPTKRTFYVFGRRKDGVIEFVREVHNAYSKKQACWFIRKKLPERLFSLETGEKYSSIWARTNLYDRRRSPKKGQLELPFELWASCLIQIRYEALTLVVYYKIGLTIGGLTTRR